MKKLYSKNGTWMFNVKVSDVPTEGKYINLYDIDLSNVIYCTLFKSKFPTHDSIFWEVPVLEMRPYELFNIAEVWENFDFYFNHLNQ
jgi:hypothetical protein